MCLIEKVPQDKVHYCERFLELLIDIEAQLPTRRFFSLCIEDVHLVVKCKLSALAHRAEGKLFVQVSSSPVVQMTINVEQRFGYCLVFC